MAAARNKPRPILKRFAEELTARQVFWSAAGVKPKEQTRQVEAGPWPSQLAIGVTQAAADSVNVLPAAHVMH